MITFHHANTRGPRAGRLKIAHLCVLKQLSSTCHVSFLAAPDTDHKHRSSLTYFTYLSDNCTSTHKRPSVHDPYLPCDVPRQSGGSTQIPPLTGYEPKHIETKAIEPEDLEPGRIGLDRNLGKDPYQMQERFMRNNFQNPITEDMDECGKFGAEMSYIQSQMHSDYESAESIADSDLEDGELRKCWLHHCKCKVERTAKSSRIPTASGKLHQETKYRETN